MSKEEGWKQPGMAQASSPLYCQGNNPGNHCAVNPDSVQLQLQLHAQLLNHPNEPVVVIQPTVYRANAPLADHEPDYMWYSLFNTLCCCICLGACALGYSRAVSIHLFTIECFL